MRYSYVLFDLDGTITESAPGILNSYEYTFQHFQVPYKKEDLHELVGPPLRDNMQKFLQAGHQLQDYVDVYRQYYGTKGIKENNMYPGIRDLLERLFNAGLKLYIASSKPIPYTEIVLAHFGVSGYFEFIGGDNMEGTRGDKEDIINHVLASNQIKDRAGAVMVGDRKYDIIGAKACGIDSIGVLYGYGSEEELKLAEADYLAPNAGEIWNIISGGSCDS